MNDTPDVSVLIVTFNGREHVRKCLASLLAHTEGIAFEVLMFDNASTDGTPDMVAEEFPHVQVVHSPTNTGFAVGVNNAIKHSSGRTLFILNPDSEIRANAIPTMLRYLAGHTDVGLLGPKLLDTEGTLQLSCRAFPSYGTAFFNRYSLLTRLLPRNAASTRYLMTNFDHAKTAEVDWLSGAAWMVPRSTIEKVGLLDEGYFWSIEDVDYCQRVHRAGLRVVYFPEVSIVHHIGGSSASTPLRAIVARHQGMWRYYSKYLAPANAPARIAVSTSVGCGIALRCSAQLLASVLRRRS